MSEDKSAKTTKSQGINTLNSSRRTFLKIAGGVLVLFGLGETAKILKSENLLRPPGGQDEAAFISKCLKCDRCRSVCPTSVIGLANLSDSILDARTPVMKFHLGYCDFCNQCVEVCPTGALKPFDIETVKIGLAVVEKEICIAWNSGGCRICELKCPYQAITLDEQNRPIVDSLKCNGCGLCENVCPALVLKTYVGGNVRGIEVKPVSERGGTIVDEVYEQE
jgi:ferredoxin-type protein NapG